MCQSLPVASERRNTNQTTKMKSSIIREFQEMKINIGDSIKQSTRAAICRAVAGDTPAKVEKFYTAWYQVTNDGPGFGTHPNLPVRTK